MSHSRSLSFSVCFLLLAILLSCGGGSSTPPTPQPTSTPTPQPPPTATIAVEPVATPIATGTTCTFRATVSNADDTTVTWSVVEQEGGSITQTGVYTAPAVPGTYTVRATANADNRVSATARAPVIIPVRHTPNYDVGVDYHAYGTNFLETVFITQYQVSGVRQVVREQLQGMADRGATVISTRIWFVTEPGTTNFGEMYRATFPMTDQEQANLRQYARDVAAVVGSGGNRLRLDICLLWLGAADYTRGTPATGLGFTPLTADVFTARVNTTTDEVIAAVADVKRPDDVPVVDTIYLEGEVMIGAKANQDWFLSTHYPAFVQKVRHAGLRPAVYFIVAGPQSELLQNGYVDSEFPILNDHRSMYWIYRSLKFMADREMHIPQRIDFSWYIADPTGADFNQILERTLNDADATLPSLGAPRLYGAAETHYFADPTQRHQLGQAFATKAAENSRMQRVCFWTTPYGESEEGMTYPFTIEDFYLPPEENRVFAIKSGGF